MVGFFAPSRSRANVGRATSRRAGKLDPAFGNSDQIALSFPIIHAVSKWRELFRFGTSRHPAPPFRSVFGIMSQSLMPFFVDRICCSRDLVFIQAGEPAGHGSNALGALRCVRRRYCGPRKLWLRNKDGRVTEDMVAGLTSVLGQIST